MKTNHFNKPFLLIKLVVEILVVVDCGFVVVATVGKPTLQPYIGGGGKLRSLFLVTPGPNMAVDEVFCCGWVVGKVRVR